MNDLPAAVVSAVTEQLLAGKPLAGLRVDGTGKVIEASGALHVFGLDGVGLGVPLVERFPHVAEYLHAPPRRAVIPTLELAPGVVADLFVLPDGDGFWIVWVDATGDAEQRRQLQQARHDLELLRESRSPPSDAEGSVHTVLTLMTTLGVAVFEQVERDAFLLVGAAPQWLASLWPDLSGGPPRFAVGTRSPFLENFLVDAETAWQTESQPAARSGPWTEIAPSGEEVVLEAVAARSGEHRLLIVQEFESQYAERWRLLQQARENALAHQALLKEIEKKDVLLHCIVHDLRAPMVSARSCLEALGSDVSQEKRAELLKVSIAQLERQDILIKTILDVFGAEVSRIDGGAPLPGESADLASCVRDVWEAMQPYAAIRGISVETVIHPDVDIVEVPGNRQRLVRVVANLVENALRHSKAGTEVCIGVNADADGILTTVDDEGPGVPPDQEQRIFDRFGQLGPHAGNVGLGLHFCRITVEALGGTIGQQNRSGGGARFWFRLPRAGA